MSDFVIFTDSGSDLYEEQMKEWGVKYCNLTFRFDGEDKEYGNYDLVGKEFYDRLREGGVSHTSAVNIYTFETAFEEELAKGNDILYLGFDSGISTTSNSGISAAKELKEKYPDRKISAIDTLCASGGLGLLVKLTVDLKKKGASFEECDKFAREMAPKIALWFTVEDLIYLKRGGRISAGAYFAASLLDIKPLLHVDEEGKLISMTKVRGRKKSIQAIIDKYAEDAIDLNGPAAVFHGDCPEDAEFVANTLKEKYGADVMMGELGAVIGSHTGPGIIFIAYPGKKR